MKFNVIFVGLLLGISSFGQTADDFEKKYGSQTYFEIRPKILMSAKFNANGEVCQVAFQPNNYSQKTRTVFLGQDGLDFVQLKEAFEEVIPKEWRSGQIKPPAGGFDFSGTIFWGDWKTENIAIEANGSANGGSDINFCDLFGTKTEDVEKRKFFFCTTSGTLEVLTITWTKRDCPKK